MIAVEVGQSDGFSGTANINELWRCRLKSAVAVPGEDLYSPRPKPLGRNEGDIGDSIVVEVCGHNLARIDIRFRTSLCKKRDELTTTQAFVEDKAIGMTLQQVENAILVEIRSDDCIRGNAVGCCVKDKLGEIDLARCQNRTDAQ